MNFLWTFKRAKYLSNPHKHIKVIWSHRYVKHLHLHIRFQYFPQLLIGTNKAMMTWSPFEYEDMGPELFWGKLATISDGTGVLQLSYLSFFMQSLLSLPHANVDIERLFSSVNLIKTKSQRWSKELLTAPGGCVYHLLVPRQECNLVFCMPIQSVMRIIRILRSESL